jgi:hypothetical protein
VKPPADLTGVASWAINLDRRPDRWLSLTNHLTGQGLPEPQRWPAVDGAATTTDAELSGYRRGLYVGGDKSRRADLGITKSWVSLLRYLAANRHTGWLLLLEDDARLLSGWAARWTPFTTACPADARIVLLGAIHKIRPQQISEHVWRARTVTCAHAWLAHVTALPELLAATGDLATSFDWAWNAVHATGHTYLTRPHLAIQDPGTRSDVSGRIAGPRPQQYGRLP